MRLLLTGATGFLGSHLARALVRNGHELVLLKRSVSDLWRIRDILPECSTYDRDRVCPAELIQFLSPIDAVIHTATCYGRNGESCADVLEANTLFPVRLLEAASSAGVPIFLNTDTFYSRAPGQWRHRGAYALSKAQFREWGAQFANPSRISFINVRLEHLYGPGDHDAKFVVQVIKSCLGQAAELALTRGDQERDFIYVQDAVAALCLLTERVLQEPGAYQEYELGTGRATSIRSFVDLVHRMTGSRTVLRYGELPYRKEEMMRSVANIEALEALGWLPRYSLEEGVRETVAWYGDRSCCDR